MTLIARVTRLADRAVADWDGHPCGAAAREVAGRLRAPLRVALAGKVKAGKSTLLNAVVGEKLAPTATAECTRVVTWYRHGPGYAARLVPRGGPARDAVLRRTPDGVLVDLAGLAPDAVDRIEVAWPGPALRAVTLVDTPGLGAVSGAGERAGPPPVDAVVYLARHLHRDDLAFLDAFTDDTGSRAAPVHALCVLSRADEVGAGRSDALRTAGAVAARLAADPLVRARCQAVVAVAGLVAEAAATLTEDEFRAVGSLARLAPPTRDAVLLSADRFGADPADLAAVGVPAVADLPDVGVRRHLLARLGVFGLRLGCDLLRGADHPGGGRVPTAAALAEALRRGSGLDDLAALLATRFAARADLLKARSALAALDELARSAGPAGSALAAEVERVRAGAHQLAELALLGELLSGTAALRPDDAAEAERLLSAVDPDGALGVPGAPAPEQAAAARELVRRWRTRAEHPLAGPAEAAAAQVLVRRAEGLAVGLRAAVPG